MKVMLDSTFVIDHLRDEPAAIERLGRLHLAGDDPIVTSIVVSEVWAGGRPQDASAIERFLRYVEYVHAGPSTARQAGEWRAELSARGERSRCRTP